MANKVYVGNLPYQFTSVDLEKLFNPHGVVRHAEVIMDRVTGRSRGFGFVEMDSPQATQDAIAALNEKECEGRNLTVNEARERTPRAGAGGGGPARSSSGGGGGGYSGGGAGGGRGGWSGGGGGGGGYSGGDGRSGGRGGGNGDRGNRGGGRHGDGDRGGRGRRGGGDGDYDG